MKRTIPLLAAAVLIFAALASCNEATAQDFDQNEIIPQMVVKVYDCTGVPSGELPNYPARKHSDIGSSDEIFPNRSMSIPHNYGGGDGNVSNQGIFCYGSILSSAPHPMEISMDDLADMITTIVEPENWDTVGGPASVSSLGGNILIVSCTQAMHTKIADLFDSLKKISEDRKNVTIEADFVELPREQIELLLADKDDTQQAVFGLVDPEEWKTVQPIYNSILTGSNHQTVSTVSGGQKKLVVSAVPVVGDYVTDSQEEATDVSVPESETILRQASASNDPFDADQPIDPASLQPVESNGTLDPFSADSENDDEEESKDTDTDPVDPSAPPAPDPSYVYDSTSRSNRSVGYQPVISVLQTGIAIEVTPILSDGGKTVLLDIRARQVEESGEAPDVIPPSSIHPSYPGPLDQPKLANWHLATTLRVPVGKRVLVGGMNSLYLFVKTTAN